MSSLHRRLVRGNHRGGRGIPRTYFSLPALRTLVCGAQGTDYGGRTNPLLRTRDTEGGFVRVWHDNRGRDIRVALVVFEHDFVAGARARDPNDVLPSPPLQEVPRYMDKDRSG